MHFISTNIGGNVHYAVGFLNSLPEPFKPYVFQVVPISDGAGAIVIFRAPDIIAANAVRHYLGQAPLPNK